MIEGDEGSRVKGLIEQRIPNLGDKFVFSPTQQILTDKGGFI
jgi:hypothetical protein